MNLDTWIAFVFASLVLTMTPGPSILLGVVHALSYGPKPVLYTALGDITANCIQMILVAFGLGVIIANSEMAFYVIKWVGVITLLYMGIKLLTSQPSAICTDPLSNTTSKSKLFTSGLLVAAGNPKAIVFFTAFFPQFIDPTQPLLPQMLIMCPTMALLDFTWVMLYALSANRFLHFLKQHPLLIHRISGTALLSASGILAISSNR